MHGAHSARRPCRNQAPWGEAIMRFVSRFTRIAANAALSLAAVAVMAHAQATDARKTPSTIRVYVADSLGMAVADAEVTLLRGLKEKVATARTNAAGEHAFIVDLDSSDYSVMARKIGYARGDRFFAAEHTVTDVRVTMKRAEGTLPAVTVTETNYKQKSYHIDA